LAREDAKFTDALLTNFTRPPGAKPRSDSEPLVSGAVSSTITHSFNKPFLKHIIYLNVTFISDCEVLLNLASSKYKFRLEMHPCFKTS
jgi:hypothetical protein